jgi:hypothetical protein
MATKPTILSAKSAVSNYHAYRILKQKLITVNNRKAGNIDFPAFFFLCNIHIVMLENGQLATHWQRIGNALATFLLLYHINVLMQFFHGDMCICCV